MNKLIIFCIFLGGLAYGWSLDLQLSVPEKFTSAFPISSEVKIALDDLESLAVSNNLSPKRFVNDYEEKLTYWTYTCTKDNPVSRFDSVKNVKKLPINKYCLELRDNDLSRYLGMIQVGIRLTQPALNQQIELGQKTTIHQPTDWMTATAAFSSKSSIVVLASENGSSAGTSAFISYDIRAGREIATLNKIEGADIRSMSLSPNGRVLSVTAHKGHAGKEVLFLDTETGNILGRLDESSGVQVWLPEISSALLKHSGNGTVLLADFVTGKVAPYEIDSKIQRWGAFINSDPSRLLVGTDQVFYLVNNERTAFGVKTTIVKDFHPKQNQYSEYDPPKVMLDGNVAIFNKDSVLFQYNLNTGEMDRIETYRFLDNKFEKLDEERLLVKLSNSDELRVFNLQEISISSIIDAANKYGSISALNGRNGFMRNEHNQLWVGEKLTVGQSVTLATLAAERDAEEQIKRMEEKEKAGREVALFGMPNSELGPENPFLIRRDIHGNMIQDAYGRPVIKGSSDQAKSIKSNLIASNIPANTKYEFIGVNQPANTSSREVQVTIQKTDRPILLFLSACNSVNWKIIKQPGSRLLGVFQQTIPTAPLSKVVIDNSEYSTQTIMRFNYCAFEKNSPEYKTLEQEILDKDGKSIEKFQSAQSGVAFFVGN